MIETPPSASIDVPVTKLDISDPEEKCCLGDFLRLRQALQRVQAMDEGDQLHIRVFEVRRVQRGVGATWQQRIDANVFGPSSAASTCTSPVSPALLAA